MTGSRTPSSPTPTAGRDHAVGHRLGGPVLVATDGTDASMPALRMAQLLAERGAALDVVAVVEPVVLPTGELGVDWREIDLAQRERLQQRVRRQLETLGTRAASAVEVVLGVPVSEISGMARRRHSALVITGLRHHGRLERTFLRGETPLRVARAAQRPVLVVPAPVERLPEVVMITTDLDEASINAARLAQPLLSGARVVHVVHVRSVTPFDERSGEHWEKVYRATVNAHTGRLLEAMELPKEVRVETRVLTGHPVDEILDYAEFARTELIVSGYHRRLLIDRVVGPRSVAERVYRGTSCAMLLVPELARPVTPEALRTDVFANADEWMAPLVAFSKRNAGRVARLEIDTSVMGVQAPVTAMPLRGVAFERTTDTLHMSFGTPGTSSHVTHSIAQPRTVELYRSDPGDDLALRVAHHEGYTLLTFVPVPAG